MYTLIIADDEEELRRAIVERVDWAAIGFEVVGEAENGAEALELVETLQADLLLTDIRMPFISGIELARQVREIRPAMSIAFLSGYDDFSYAQQAIQYNIISYLLKPLSLEELTDEMIRIREKMDQSRRAFRESEEESSFKRAGEFLMPLLLESGGAELSPETLRLAVEYGLMRDLEDRPHYIVLALRMEDAEGNNRTRPNHVAAVDMILKKYVRFGSFYMNGRVVSLVAENSFELSEYLHILLDELVQSVDRVMGMRLLIGVSRETDSLAHCAAAYQEALAALDYSKAETGAIHSIFDIEHFGKLEYELVRQSAQELETLLRTGQKEEITAFVDRLFETLERLRPARSDVNLLLIQLTATVCQAVSSVSENEAAVAFFANLPLGGNLQRLSALSDIRRELTALCIRAREVILSQHKLNSEILCDRAGEIIRGEYGDESLSLVSLSEKLHVSPNYLSALLKKTKGETFTALLTSRRMQVAREHLLCTSMKIAEISDRCGFSDQHYFSYCFKKYYGVSPNKMREQAAGRYTGTEGL